MPRRLAIIAVIVLMVVGIAAAIVWTVPVGGQSGERGLARDGAFGFPQADAAVLIDNADYRVSLYSDDRYLFVQSVVWHDGDDSLGETVDGRAIGDRTNLYVDVDGNGEVTPNVDRVYLVNYFPSRPGLYYQLLLGDYRRTHVRQDSAGRAAIRYLDTPGGGRVRVDSIVIPLAELGRRPGQSVRLAVWTRSEHPDLTLNSLGVAEPPGVGGSGLPTRSYHVVTLVAGRPPLDPTLVPRDRDKAEAAAQAAPRKPMPEPGSVPPEFVAEDWINTDGPLTLAGLRGQVVLIDFWHTNCGDCLAGIPHLNELQHRYGPRGFKIVAFSENSRQGIEWFMQAKARIDYAVGTGSNLKVEYGIRNVPYAFLIGRDGTVLWHGMLVVDDVVPRIEAALGPE
jgi:thiol-disulfide isomerase/thioredoxin